MLTDAASYPTCLDGLPERCTLLGQATGMQPERLGHKAPVHARAKIHRDSELIPAVVGNRDLRKRPVSVADKRPVDGAAPGPGVVFTTKVAVLLSAATRD